VQDTWQTLFEAIPDAGSDLPEAEFYDSDLDTLPPRIFLPSGDPYTPPGPVRLEEIARRRRVRFVKVILYRFEQVGAGFVARPSTWAYGWQGDNGIVHLYHAPANLEEIPDALEEDTVYNESYLALMRAMGYADGFIDF
jgi:hypothetical protein